MHRLSFLVLNGGILSRTPQLQGARMDCGGARNEQRGRRLWNQAFRAANIDSSSAVYDHNRRYH